MNVPIEGDPGRLEHGLCRPDDIRPDAVAGYHHYSHGRHRLRHGHQRYRATGDPSYEKESPESSGQEGVTLSP